MNLYQLQYCVAIIQICIFGSYNGDTGDYDIIKTKKSTLPVASPEVPVTWHLVAIGILVWGFQSVLLKTKEIQFLF